MQFLYYCFIIESEAKRGLSSRVREQGLSPFLRDSIELAALFRKTAKPGTGPSRSGTRSLVSVPFCAPVLVIKEYRTAEVEELHPKFGEAGLDVRPESPVLRGARQFESCGVFAA
jgi:hypothetical protein